MPLAFAFFLVYMIVNNVIIISFGLVVGFIVDYKNEQQKKMRFGKMMGHNFKRYRNR